MEEVPIIKEDDPLVAALVRLAQTRGCLEPKLTAEQATKIAREVFTGLLGCRN